MSSLVASMVPTLAASAMYTPHACEMVDIEHALNLDAQEQYAILDIYMSVVRTTAPEQAHTPVAARLAKEVGGFWDVIFWHARPYSFAMLCEAQLDLAAPGWHVTLCRESVDELGRNCDRELREVSHGSLVLPADLDAMTATAELREHEHYMDHMFEVRTPPGGGSSQHRVTLEPGRVLFKRKRQQLVLDALRRALAHAVQKRLGAADLAKFARAALDEAIPSEEWNVVFALARSKNDLTAAYYFSEESFTYAFALPASGADGNGFLEATVYDRRCKHNFAAEGMEEAESHNSWQGFEEKGTDEDGIIVYGDKYRYRNESRPQRSD